MTLTKIEPKSKGEPAMQWQPFPIDQLPPSMRDIATGVQNTVGLKDSSTPAIATLAMVSGAIGSSCKIRIKPGYLQPAHLYTAIIGKSGQAKSGTKEYLLDPLQEKQSEWYEEWEQENEKYKMEMREYRSAKKGERPEYPIEPDPPKRIIVSDITIEAIGQRLKENPLGLLLYNDELETFFGNMGRYSKGNDLPHWLSIHNGQPLYIDRKGAGSIRIPNPSVAIIGGIQPKILKDRLQENPDYFHSGFLARFLLAMPPVEPILLNDNIISERISGQWGWFLKSLLGQRELAIIDGKLTPYVFPIESGAWDILTKYQHRHAVSATLVNDSESALEGKFLTNTARIALILHAVNQIEAGVNFSDCKPIPVETMESACKIVEWFIDESKRIYTLLAGENVDGTLTPDQQEVMKVLAKHQPATERDIKRHCTEIREKWESGKLEKVLIELLKLDRVTRHTESGKGNRGTTWWKMKIPTTDSNDTDTNSAEHGKYGINGSVITDIAPKNDFATLSEFDQFTEMANSTIEDIGG